MLTLLSLAALAAPPSAPDCDRAFFARIFPDGAPPRPPLGPILVFAWDADDSGRLEPEEEAALHEAGVLRCEALDVILETLDADTDGTITAEERDSGLRALFGPPPPPPPRDRRPAPGQLPPPLLHSYDLDGDGALSPSEKTAARADLQDRYRDGLPPVPPPSEVR